MFAVTEKKNEKQGKIIPSVVLFNLMCVCSMLSTKQMQFIYVSFWFIFSYVNRRDFVFPFLIIMQQDGTEHAIGSQNTAKKYSWKK